jgi:hypothetical protein
MFSILSQGTLASVALSYPSCYMLLYVGIEINTNEGLVAKTFE